MAENGQSTGIQKDTARRRRKFYLSSHVKTRKALATLINELHADQDADIPRYRALGYLLNCMLGYWQLEQGLELEARFEALEQKVEIIMGGKNKEKWK